MENIMEYRNVECCICKEFYPENDICWELPHEASENMEDGRAFVCSGLCALKWVDINFESIEEFNEIKG